MNPTRRKILIATVGAATALTLGRFALGGNRTPIAASNVFMHGVASGDPLTDAVILWTRVTPLVLGGAVEVEWFIAEDPGLVSIVDQGRTSTGPWRDYTVKVEAHNLAPGSTYYYRFHALGIGSPAGRTRTLPIGDVERLRFAVVSCANWPFGFFNAYRLIAERTDLDAVLHLGDYIYEYANGEFGDGTPLGRIPRPDNETITLSDYRTRHAQYKTDTDLQEAHRQHPFIAVWDDHESANNSWMHGAQNHNPELGEGPWFERRLASQRAYFEWMPIREQPLVAACTERPQIFRRFGFGKLADLIMLDTRLYGRDRQPDRPADDDPHRQLLGVNLCLSMFT